MKPLLYFVGLLLGLTGLAEAGPAEILARRSLFAEAGGNQGWSLGRWEKGLHLDLDMGGRRQNWNHARIAVHPFVTPSDWREFDGLRLVVTTRQPRRDAAVSVWVGEADGSWYYLKSAVPLSGTNNSAVLWFEDFAEAEWVAPGNHMDEDYVLDRTAIGGLGIGVVNPFGIGEVSFTVTELELVRRAPQVQPPARAEVSGRLLTVNGHSTVPPGIFGGYAPELPQRYRPGCQRHLWAGATPRVPRQHWVGLKPKDIGDSAALEKALAADTALGRHLRSLLEPLPANRRQRKLLDILQQLQRDPKLFEPAAWAETRLSPTDREQAERMRRGELNDTQIKELNRRLLAAAFPEWLTPAPAGRPTELFYVDCHGERYERAHLLQNPNWRESLADLGRAFGNNALRAGYVAHLEFWNEPYLNWAERSRVNLNSRFYRTDNIKEGDPVQVQYRRRDGTTVDGPVIPHFKWTRQGSGELRVVDETAFSYWSGRGNGFIYDEMLAVLGPALKAANPAVQVIAGWGFRWNEDHWAAWDLLYQPTIDRHIAYIDGVHEHHYQGDTTAMNGTYEMLSAYGVTRHGKWLHSYNTETSDLVDAPARGLVDTPGKVKAASAYRKGTYNLRDCLYSVLQSPDKLRSRTVIHNDAPAQLAPGTVLSNSWTDVSYGLLANLRGHLLETASDDPNLWCVASLDGTDPDALPPAGTPPTLVVFLFNDHRQPRTAQLRIRAPGATRFSSAFVEQTTLDRETFRYGRTQQSVAASGTVHEVNVTLPERSAWKINLPLSGQPLEGPRVARTQYFAPELLRIVTEDQPLVTTVKVAPTTLATAQQARLRLVLEDLAEAEGVVEIGGETFPLPKALTADNVNRIVEVSVPIARLKPETVLKFRAAPGAGGYRVAVASVVLDHPPQ